MRAVPFTLGDDLDEELSVRGRVAFGGASLILELETASDGSELAAPRKVVILLEEFSACRFRRGLLGDRLHLRTSSLGALGGIPGASMDTVTLRFEKRDRDAAELLAERLNAVLSEMYPQSEPLAIASSPGYP